MTVRMGRKLAELGDHVVGESPLANGVARGHQRAARAPGTYPVGLGVALRRLGLAEADAFAVHQYGVADDDARRGAPAHADDHLDTQAILFEVNARRRRATTSAVAAADARRHGRLRAA